MLASYTSTLCDLRLAYALDITVFIQPVHGHVTCGVRVDGVSDQATGWMVRVSNPVRRKRLNLFCKTSRPSLGPT